MFGGNRARVHCSWVTVSGFMVWPGDGGQESVWSDDRLGVCDNVRSVWLGDRVVGVQGVA